MVHLVKDLYKDLCVCRTERRQVVLGLFSPKCRGKHEGDKLRLEPEPHEVFLGDRREVYAKETPHRWILPGNAGDLDSLCGMPAGISNPEPLA